MASLNSYTILLLGTLACCSFCEGGLIKGRRQKNDESVETLLAVGLIAKALSDVESPPPKVQCPAPIQVTRIVPVPVHKERVIFLKDKDCEGRYHESRQLWGPPLSSEETMESSNWKRK